MSKKTNKVKTVSNQKTETIKADLLREAVLLTCSFSKWGNRRKAKVAQLTETESGESTGTLALTETKRLKVSKQLIVSKEYDAIVNFQQKLYSQVQALTVPSFIKEGFYLLHTSKVQTVIDIFAESKPKLAELVSALVAVYESKIEQAKLDFAGGTLFRQADYPTGEALPTLFSIDFNFFNFEVSQELPPEVLAAEQVKLQNSFKQAEGLIAEVLTEGFSEVLADVQRKLAPKPDGTAQAFHKTLFDDLSQFMSNFSSRNLVKNEDLANLVDKANSILASVRGGSAQEKAIVVKSSDELRDSTRKSFAEIQTAIAETIRPKLGRAFNFDLD